ncbi:hypothetical protein [Methyloferula stellata]|uniref:hypothetical protein n=1 Tax=Methyloferula stellata TaxID=876270 RepID=UPI000364733E|nr:hypothetical protein [Methyloferula stellata]
MATKYTIDKIQHHLNYEICMLNGSYALIMKIDDLLEKAGASHLQRQDALNAMKENFCLHTRVLAEFFIQTRTNSASDFATPEYIPGKAPAGMIQKLNNQLSHLMDNRTEIDTDKIQGADRDAYLRWISDELQRWLPMRAPEYSMMDISNVDLSAIPLGNLFSGSTETTNYVSSVSSPH